MVLGVETESRDEADSVRLPGDVAVNNREIFEFATVTGGNHSKAEGEFDRETEERCLAEGLEGGTRQEAQDCREIPGRDQMFLGRPLNEHPSEKMFDQFAVGD